MQVRERERKRGRERERERERGGGGEREREREREREIILMREGSWCWRGHLWHLQLHSTHSTILLFLPCSEGFSLGQFGQGERTTEHREHREQE